MIGMRYPYEVNLVGDAATDPAGADPAAAAQEGPTRWRETIEANVAAGGRRWTPRPMVEADPINPMRLFAELSRRLPDDAIVTADSGSSANWYARQLRFRGDMRGSLSGNLATMGPGSPTASAPSSAHPDRPVIVFAGDGAMQMNGTGRADHHQALLAAVGRPAPDRRGPAQQRPQPGHLGDAGDGRRTQVRRVPDAARRRLRRLRRQPRPAGHHRRRPRRRRSRRGSRRSPPTGPTVLDVHADPDVPPIPPHATFEQMKDTAEALLKGDEDRGAIIKEGVKTKIRSSCPHVTTDLSAMAEARCAPAAPV